MIYPVILGWCQVEIGLSEPLENPRLFGFFLTIATCLPNMLSIPCFYYLGSRYVEHKKKEEAFIEAAESFQDRDIVQLKGNIGNEGQHE